MTDADLGRDLEIALMDALRWLDSIEQRRGREALLNAMPNNCLSRGAMRAVLERAKEREDANG